MFQFSRVFEYTSQIHKCRVHRCIFCTYCNWSAGSSSVSVSAGSGALMSAAASMTTCACASSRGPVEMRVEGPPPPPPSPPFHTLKRRSACAELGAARPAARVGCSHVPWVRKCATLARPNLRSR